MKKIILIFLTACFVAACSNSEKETTEKNIQSIESSGSQQGDTSSYQRMPEIITDSVQR